MIPGFPLFPEQASTFAPEVDALYFFLVGVSLFFSILIFGLVFFFAIRYRRRSESERPRPIIGSLRLEVLWSVIPLCLSMMFFAWGAQIFFHLNTPPADTMNLFVVGKQWMWKIQHPEGKREINELHIPAGRPIKLTMTSEDVIHSFYVPAFRTKMDVLPGRYTTTWFEASKPGKYHLFCAEYCGTEHSGMGGWVYVMDPVDYDNWLSGNTGSALSMAQQGEQLFTRMGCVTCHTGLPDARGPELLDLYQKPVRLADGRTVIADEAYLRESILSPTAGVVAGYQPVMPTYQGQVSEENLLKLIAYIKSLSVAEETTSDTVPEGITQGRSGAK